MWTLRCGARKTPAYAQGRSGRNPRLLLLQSLILVSSSRLRLFYSNQGPQACCSAGHRAGENFRLTASRKADFPTAAISHGGTRLRGNYLPRAINEIFITYLWLLGKLGRAP